MNKHIYEKMAVTNVKKSGKLYLPYLITIIGSMMFYYILTSIGSNPHIYNVETGKQCFKGASTLCGILQSGSFVAAAFAFIFLLYANSFVFKHQKKQLGLYGVLGMERKHIVRVVSTETLLIFFAGLITSLILGILFDKLMLVFLFKIINQSAYTGFFISIQAVKSTVCLTAAIALFVLLGNLISVFSTKDIDLLKSEKTGEKEPKDRKILALSGILSLAAGYWIALDTQNVASAISNFFPAAILVILATYGLFTAGSIAVLKLLKKNKSYYYTPKHFISVSGMLYRMKQNAAGLATICILSTATIIVISAGASLYANGNYSINQQFPRMVQFASDTKDADDLKEIIDITAKDGNISLQDMVSCSYGTSFYEFDGKELKISETFSFTDFEHTPDTFILTLEEYNRFNHTSETLEKNQILLYTTGSLFEGNTLTYEDVSYQVKAEADKSCLTYITDTSMVLFPKLLIVVPNEEVFNSFVPKKNELAYTNFYLGFNMNLLEEDIEKFGNYISKNLDDASIVYDFALKHVEKGEFFNMYGGLFFVGMILGILFLISTVMIIYYKQISEGYDDRERYLIMQKVGLSKEEIRQSIHSQVMLVFFLPLVTAIIHSCVALPIVSKCLSLALVVNMPTFVLSVVGTCVVFSVVYMVVYKVTSKEYYKIVNE
ncbi:MAG: ABC transporter permease [Lachnospiraceae bacterium]|nr:ABC transporter permease [Lachnospiraceae bacterium]